MLRYVFNLKEKVKVSGNCDKNMHITLEININI